MCKCIHCQVNMQNEVNLRKVLMSVVLLCPVISNDSLKWGRVSLRMKCNYYFALQCFCLQRGFILAH